MNIYLAGKIEKNCWRHSIVDDLRIFYFSDGTAMNRHDDLTTWPTLDGSIFGRHDYTGPYFTACDHGCYHGATSHGVGVLENRRELADHGGHVQIAEFGCGDPGSSGRGTINKCFHAIRTSQLVFAWIDTLDCCGTLCELGYAIREALPSREPRPAHIEVVVAHPPDFDVSELWFPLRAADAVVTGETPRVALRSWLIDNGHLTPKLYIYFIEAVGLDRIKIGKDNDPDGRLAILQTGSPVLLKLLGKTPGGASLEGKLRGDFSNSRIDCEWFHATRELRDYIGGLTHAG